MRVSEIMHTPVVSTGPHATLREVANLMKARNVGCVVIVDQMGYLAGIITDRDIAVRGVASGRSPDVPVDAIMTRDVATVLPNADVATAETTMRKRGIRRLPVADDMWQPHGLISLDDVLRSFGHEVDTMADTVAEQRSDSMP